MDKYVYITLHQTFFEELIIKYSHMETGAELEEIQHPLIREALRVLRAGSRASLEITSMSDIPAGTGLGSSGSFLTALLHALHIHKKSIIPKHDLAEQACHIEIDRLGEPVGKQDQYISAFGGLTCFRYCTMTGASTWRRSQISSETLANLEDNLVLFYTGYTRSASDILNDQDQAEQAGRSEALSTICTS